MKQCTRRSMLKLLGATTLFSAFGGVFSIANAEELDILKETQITMDTTLTLLLRSSSRALREDTAQKAFAYIKPYIAMFNRFNTSSPIAVLNAEGKVGNAPSELQYVISEARIYELRSRGLFNSTVKPLLDYIAMNPTVSMQDYREARALVQGANDIVCTNGTIQFTHAGMGITLDGIAKGYIIDLLAGFVEKEGIHDYIINAGGDIRVAGVQAENTPWSIGIQSPTNKTAIVQNVMLKSGAIATSGGYERYALHDAQYTHLVNPFTAKSPTTIISATVTAPTAMQADALATTISFMQPQQALRYIAQYPETACMVLTQNSSYTSPTWDVA